MERMSRASMPRAFHSNTDTTYIKGVSEIGVGTATLKYLFTCRCLLTSRIVGSAKTAFKQEVLPS